MLYFLFSVLQCKLEHAIAGVDCQKHDTLHAGELAAYKGGDDEEGHDGEHHGDVDGKGCVHAEGLLFLRDAEGRQDSGYAAD